MSTTIHFLKYRGPFGPGLLDSMVEPGLPDMTDFEAHRCAAKWEKRRLAATTDPLTLRLYLHGFDSVRGDRVAPDPERFSAYFQPIMAGLVTRHGDDMDAVLCDLKSLVDGMSVDKLVTSLDEWERTIEKF